MVRKVTLFLFLPCMVLALFLSLVGVRQIGYGDTYINFLRNISRVYDNWSFSIPDIPKLKLINEGDYDKSGLILAVLIKIANFFVNFVNVLITLLNINIKIFNIFIAIIQFFISFIICIKDFIQSLRQTLFVI